MTKITTLAQQIKSGKYPTEKVQLAQFFKPTVTGEMIPDRESRIQVRDRDRDIDRINRAVNKMKVSGNTSGLEPLTCIKFPKLGNILKIGNGNHTAEMALLMGMTESDAYIVDYEKDLGGKKSNAIQLGNLLNKQEVEKVDVHDNDIRNELYQMMDERAEEGLDPKLPKNEIKELLARYPHISSQTVGNWVSNRDDVGGRREPLISYTKGQLIQQVDAFENMVQYKDYVVCDPRTLVSWSDTGISAAFSEMQEHGKRKALVILYCSTVAQADQWAEGNIEKTIREKYAKLGEWHNVTIDVQMLRYE